MSRDLQHILITGAAGAIGGELATLFRDRHPQAAMTLVDLNETELRKRARDLNAFGSACDLTDIEALPDWWQRVVNKQGPVDMLINCAGIMDIMTLTGTGWERGRRILDINFTAPMRLMDLAAPAMLEKGRGCIINVASMAGRVPIRGCSYYGSAKAGIGMASEIARMDMKDSGVRVITVYPGPIYSGLENHARAQVESGPVARYIPTGKPEELAQRVYDAFRKQRPRVIYPDVYRLARFVGQTDFTYRFMDALSPQPNQ
jgi:dehydrogenase/reductase SDR family protein 7B